MEWPAQYDVVIDRGSYSFEKNMDEISEEGEEEGIVEDEDRMETCVGEND